MADEIKFWPIRGTEEQVLAHPIYDGKVLFTTDTNKIYFDVKNERHLMGRGNSGIYFAKGSEEDRTLVKEDPENEADMMYFLEYSALEDQTNLPKIDDLILNGDGKFFRVMEQKAGHSQQLYLQLLLVSGSGEGGGGSSLVRGSVNVELVGESDILNGDTSGYFNITGRSATYDGQPVDQRNMKLSIEFYASTTGDSGSYVRYDIDNDQTIDHEQTIRYDFSSRLRDSTYHMIVVRISGSEDNKFTISSSTQYINTHALNTEWISSSFSANSLFESSVRPYVQITSGARRILDIYFDNQLVFTRIYNNNDNTTSVDTTINANSPILNEDGTRTGSTLSSISAVTGQPYYSHGSHIISAKLSLAKSDGTRGSSTDLIKKEIAIKTENRPLIWLGDYKDSYYEYDNVVIPFRVYNPDYAAEGIEVRLYKDSEEINSSPRYINPESSEWSYWEITGIKVGDDAYYTIKTGIDENETSKEVEFEVLEDPRNMAAVEGATMSFSAAGRSNTEASTKRGVIDFNGSRAVLSGFNWYNNGWVSDNDSNTCLRISNGAKVEFPIGRMGFQGGSNTTKAHTIEFLFKVRNVQDYSKIITKYTRYTTDTGWSDDALFEEFKEQRATGYINYDAYLAYRLPKLREQFPDAGYPEYDDLKYAKTEPVYNFNSVAAYFANALSESAPGFYMGPQDAYFFNGTEMVTVDYVENELISLSVMCSAGSTNQGDDRLMQIYINGMLTGVARSKTYTGGWTIDAQNLIFTSNICDIDLYKIRVYDNALSAQEVVQNRAFDLKDTMMWDQKNLVTYNNDIGEYVFSYKDMLTYNAQYSRDPDNILMPYMVIHTTSDQSNNRLPWSKKTEVIAGWEFVNTALDAAYRRGDLTLVASNEGYDSVEEYYKHHCPSFYADKVSFKVQGTSSEFYPRRNYKAKTKVKVDGKDYISLKYNRGPFAEAYNENPASTAFETWYYDNDTVGTNKWTLKIDYMESSGTYNMGLANLVKEAYSHHPMADYIAKNAFKRLDDNGDDLIGNLDDYRTSVQGFPVLTFHQKDDGSDPIFIGRYNMLLDKGSDEAYGFKLNKGVLQNYLNGEPVRNMAECWEMENNSRGFCSFRDPWNRYNLSFKAPVGSSNEFTSNEAPIIADYFEYRYSPNDDLLDVLYDPKTQFTENNQSLVDDITINALDKITKETAYSEVAVTEASFEKKKYYLYVNGQYVKTNKLDGVSDDYNAIIEAYGSNVKFYEESVIIKNSNGVKVDLINDKDSGRQLMLDMYSNWEKAVQWVWSTATDATIDFGDGYSAAVPNMYTYTEIKDLAEALYAPNRYYILSDFTADGAAIYTIVTDEEFDEDKVYYILEETAYRAIKLTNNADKVYAKNTYYKATDTESIYLLAEEDFDPEAIYYAATVNTNLNSHWRLTSPVTYGNTTYEYDTIEYRLAKFKNELSSHFNLEYLATYFVITEVLECYDSRGKNAMFASWGPQDNKDPNNLSKGQYIWYPLFYDMDTQLGINNTGIPSFEYYVDATIDGSFSTNDSVLWNNYYTLFFGDIISKYKQLKGQTDDPKFGTLNRPPFRSIQEIENWYIANPDNTGSYSMMGSRPLLAFNMDEHYKYISITNDRVGRIDDSGEIINEGDTYFYALQGDRSLSRTQFLTNRINYINSWLTLDNYARGGANRIRSRVSANNPVNTSDKWISSNARNGMADLTINEKYWADEQEHDNESINSILNRTSKKHMFDGEYWITMTPARNSYVTVGTDTANFPSIKYSGSPVIFETSDLENGVKNSGNYREQLYYIYGIDQMKSLGDLSKLYFQEFELSGKAGNMTDLLLGYDGLDENGNEYRNNDVNTWTIPAQAGTISGGMPLLKEVNLSNITFKDNNVTFDFSSSEKLRNFRNTGSNITSVTFADGVALDTLYLTNATTTFRLVEADMLTDLVTAYTNPVLNAETNRLVATPGLYIKDLTDKSDETATTKITTLSIDGGSLGYNSYKLLNKYYHASLNDNPNTLRRINLTGIEWTPYILIDNEETVYDTTKADKYFIDNGHFGLDSYEFKTNDAWVKDIQNRIVYEYNEEKAAQYSINSTSLLEELITRNNFVGTLADSSVPNITGYIYVNNGDREEDVVDEGEVQKDLQEKYPNLHFFFKNVNRGYSAKFVLEENGIQTVVKTQKISRADYEADNNIFFVSPLDESNSATYISDAIMKNLKSTNYDFYGWAFRANSMDSIILSNPGKDQDGNYIVPEDERIDTWSSQHLTAGVYDYTFYAIYDTHKYLMTFLDGDNTVLDVRAVEAGTRKIDASGLIPYLDDSALPLIQTYRFTGVWKTHGGQLIENVSATRNWTFIPEFSLVEDVHTEITDLSIFDFEEITAQSALTQTTMSIPPAYWIRDNAGNPLTFTGYRIKLLENAKVKGKVTLPLWYNDKPVITIDSSFNDMREGSSKRITHIFWGYDERGSQLVTIGRDAFASSANKPLSLKYIEIPDSVICIDQGAFNQSCSLVGVNQMNAVVLPSSLLTINRDAFNNAFDQNDTTGLSQILIPSNVVAMYLNAFGNMRIDVNTVQFGNVIEGSHLVQLGNDTIKNVDNPTISGSSAFYSHNQSYSQGTSSLLFYTNDTTQYEAFYKYIGNGNFKHITSYQRVDVGGN